MLSTALILCLGFPLIGVCLAPAPARAALSVAIIDHQDQWSRTRGLGQLLTDLGQSYTDLTSQLTAGQALNLAGYDLFIVGSFCTENANIRTALTSPGGETAMNQFVNNGGTIIMLTQADQTVAEEAWVQSPVRVARGDPDFNAVYRVQVDHQIFNAPESISNANLQGWQYLGSSTWPTSWESLVTFQQVGVLAGDDSPEIINHAAIVEAGWGAGRALFLSLAVDKARNIGNAQAKAQAPRLMRNMLQYAENVKAGSAPPIIIYQGGSGWSGPITGHVFVDANGNGIRDEGEEGAAGVGVSDTIDLVLTAADGTYTLPNAAGNAKLLYICPPGGYAKNGRWYQRLTAASSAADFDFGLKPADEPVPFDFVQITDTHVGASGSKALLSAALAQIGELKKPPAFVLATGDLTDVGSSLTQYEDYAAAVNSSPVPVFSVFGNHDANNGTSSNYRRFLGPDYYSFHYGDCHFLVINSVHKTAAQANWVAKNLQLLRGSRRLFIFQHYSPSAQEHDQFSSWSATAVFTGHWHSQHSVQVGQMRSYNTANLLFGGIDCSPAGFKVIHVDPDEISTRTRWLADGKRLQIVTPANSLLIPEGDLMIVVNAYETSADLTSVAYELKAGASLLAEGSLSAEGDWTWRGSVPAAKIARGAYALEVKATNDRGEETTASTSFMVLGMRPPRAAPQQDWTQFGGGAERGGVAPATLDPPLAPVWCRNTGGTFDFASPVLKEDVLYLGIKDRGDFQKNGVMALRADSGDQVWFTPTPAAVSHSVAVDQARVYACSHGGILHALSRSSGEQIWSQILGSDVQRFQYSGPVLAGDKLFAGTFAYFGAFDAATGQKSWNRSYGGDWISCNACPAVKGDTVIVPANWDGNSLRAVDATTGNVRWQYAVQGLHGSPVIAGDRVVFTDYNGQIHCADLATGEQRWKRDLGGGRSASTPAVSDNIVVAGGTGSIRAFQLDTGTQIWQTPISTSPLKMAPYNNTFAALVGSPTIAGQTAYVPCGDGRLYALALATGEVQWSMEFGTPLLSAPCISGNVLYVTAFDGNVYALAKPGGGAVAADFDQDADVDQEDFGHLQACLSPEGVLEILDGCADANLNGDSIVDQADMQAFISCFSGPNQWVDWDCLQ